jgi:hypothetical protein
MANYSTANLVKAQIWLNSEFQSAEQRFRVPAVFQLFNSTDSRRLFPNYETLKTAVNRTIEANYFLRTSSALVTTGITHNHTGTQGDSGTLTPSWTPYSATWSMTLKQANISTKSWQELFNDNLSNKVADFAEGLDDVSSAYLFNNRTGVNAAAVKGTFNATDDAYEITQATYGDESMSITRVVMDINKYQGGVYDVVCDSTSFTTFQLQAAQGAQNSTNLSFQFMSVTFIHDPALAARAVALNALYVKGFWLAVPRGTVSVLPWIPTQNRQGVSTKENIYGSIMNPVDGLQYGTHEYGERSDGSAVNGQTQDVLTEYQMFIFLAFEKAPLSVATETTIYAFALV